MDRCMSCILISLMHIIPQVKDKDNTSLISFFADEREIFKYIQVKKNYYDYLHIYSLILNTNTALLPFTLFPFSFHFPFFFFLSIT